MQKELFDRYVPSADVVYTPEQVSRQIISYLNPSGVCLDPCKGDGAFYKYLPEGALYCEITERKDFFDFTDKIDWIIGNPPYSNFKEFLEHAFMIAENVSFLVPTNKVFQRPSNHGYDLQIWWNKINDCIWFRLLDWLSFWVLRG